MSLEGKPHHLAACAQCPCLDAPIVPPSAPRGPALAIVGEAPGHHEVREGRPFVGASGRMLGRMLKPHGLHRYDCHITNAILCECTKDGMTAARKCCAPRLQAELAASKVPVIMPVGAWGLQSALQLTRKPQVLAWRGSVSKHPTLPAFVLPTVHPAFVLRSERWEPVLQRDIERVVRVMRQGFTAPENDPGRRIIVARNRATLTDGLAAFDRSRTLGFDVETVGLGPTRTALVCFALSDGPTTLVVPWSRGANGQEPWWPDAGSVGQEISWTTEARTLVTHNGPAFDHLVAERYGLEVHKWEDTLLAYHALAGHMPKNLAHVVTQYLDVPPWKQWEHSHAIEDLWIYNARDTLYTVLAWEAMQEELGT